MVKFENNWSFSLKDVIWFAGVIFAISAAWFGLPSKIMTNVDAHYVGKEVYAADNRTLTEKFENLQKSLDRIWKAVK